MESALWEKVSPVRLRNRGQITIPQAMRDSLNIVEGDALMMVQVGQVLLLARKRPQVPRLADKIAAMMEAEGVSLADLLAGLAKERETIWRERQRGA